MRRAAIGALAALLLAAAPAAAKGPFAQVAEGTRGTWVASPELGLLRVAEGRVAAAVDVGQAPMAVAAAGEDVWTLTLGGGVARVGARDDRVRARRALRLDAADLAVGGGSLWAVGSRGVRPAEAVLLRLDRRTLRVLGTFHLGRRAAPRLAAGHGRVWLAFDPVSRRDRLGLVAIDEATGRLALRRRLPGFPRAVASGRRGMWLLSEEGGDGRLREIDPDGRVRRDVGAPFQPGDVAVAGGRVWVTSLCGGPSCDVTRASVRAYDEDTGRPAGDPFRPRCASGRENVFLSGLGATAAGAVVARGRSEAPGLDLVVLNAGDRAVRCVPLPARPPTVS